MKQTDTASWTDNVLTMIGNYDWPEPHQTAHQCERLPLADGRAEYVVAADGDCYALRDVSKPTTTCIATVESMVIRGGAKAAYVTFRPKNFAPSALARWQKKWSARTSNVTDRFDASVRMAA